VWLVLLLEVLLLIIKLGKITFKEKFVTKKSCFKGLIIWETFLQKMEVKKR
jgi:hypothetical protein